VWRLERGEGGYVQKIFWWREGYDCRTEPQPALRVEIRNVDGARSSPRVVDGATCGYRDDDPHGFMLTGVGFPSPGCWEVTSTYAGDRLTFVVLVEEYK
jgi:hypothetical protein